MSEKEINLERPSISFNFYIEEYEIKKVRRDYMVVASSREEAINKARENFKKSYHQRNMELLDEDGIQIIDFSMENLNNLTFTKSLSFFKKKENKYILISSENIKEGQNDETLVHSRHAFPAQELNPGNNIMEEF